MAAQEAESRTPKEMTTEKRRSMIELTEAYGGQANGYGGIVL